MKALASIFILVLFSGTMAFGQASLEMSYEGLNLTELEDDVVKEKNGSDYSILTTAINTKYSEIGSGLFRDKLMMVSSKKIGALGSGVDPNTGQPFTDLFCIDVKDDGELKRPLLFSRILNTKNNEGQITFSRDEKTIYFTRSSRENPSNYKLYRAELEENSNGNWVNIEKLAISSDFYSVENPFLKENTS